MGNKQAEHRKTNKKRHQTSGQLGLPIKREETTQLKSPHEAY